MMNSRQYILLAIYILKLVPTCCQKNFDINDAKSYYLSPEDAKYGGNEKIPFNRIIVKSLWLQKGMEDTLLKDKSVTTDLAQFKIGTCNAELEIFSVTGDNYFPLLKIKNDFWDASFTRARINHFLLLPFDSLFTNLAGSDIETRLQHKKNYTWSQLHENYMLRFDMPILKAQPTERGVFLSFESFKQNKTSYPDFVFKQSTLTDEVYKSKDEEILTEYWGFFDGKDYYVKTGKTIFKLVRQNNSFDFFGSRYLYGKRSFYDKQSTYNYYPGNSSTIGNMPITTTYRPQIKKEALQINMETGEAY